MIYEETLWGLRGFLFAQRNQKLYDEYMRDPEFARLMLQADLRMETTEFMHEYKKYRHMWA